jgi:glycosyltransferase involved in cell wall biosynthesis
MKNEGEYLKEWLDYHIKIGVEKFYLCDNESTDNTCKILQPYIEKGIVDYTYWKGKGQQLSTYRNAIKRTKTKWLAFIDLDEFIVYKGESIIDFLKRQPDNVSQVSLGWVIYGSNGHIKKPKGGIIENYQYRAKRNCSCKSISKPMAAYSCNSAHCTHVIGRTINENERTIIPSRDVVLPFEKFRINHYQVKSLEEYRIRQKRGDVGTSSDRYSDEFFKKYDRNEVYDPL